MPVASYREKLLGATHFATATETAHVIVPAASVDDEGHLSDLDLRYISSERGGQYCLPSPSKVDDRESNAHTPQAM